MPRVDLHVHSTASDGEVPPADVIEAAKRTGLAAVALTDHDTLDGLEPALSAAAGRGIQVVPGCEFSVAVTWGEMHLLGYFLPFDDPELNHFLGEQRTKRVERAQAIVDRLHEARVPAELDVVIAEAGAGSVGRPHVARTLVKSGAVRTVNEAFDRFLADGRPAYVPKDLPSLEQVTELVRRVAGVTSAAHLGSRATRSFLVELKAAGVDGIEVIHPAHDDGTVRRVRALSGSLNMLPTGGSDWHGDSAAQGDRASLGSLQVPESWLKGIEALHMERMAR